MAVKQIFCIFIFGTSLLAASQARATTGCSEFPNVLPLLQLDEPDWVVAQVTMLPPPPPATRYGGISADFSIDRVFAGKLDAQRITIFSNEFLDCGISTHALDIGSSYIIGSSGPRADGSFGGLSNLAIASIEDDIVGGQFLTRDAPSEFIHLDEFVALVNANYPRAETENYLLEMEPLLPSRGESVSLKVTRTGGDGCSGEPKAISVDRVNGEINVSLQTFDIISLCPTDFKSFEISLPPLGKPAGSDSYSVNVYEEGSGSGAPPFSSSTRIATFDYKLRPTAGLSANPEVPAQDSIQSGVGVIRGWVCEANSVQVQFNDLPRFKLAYGTSRTDTRTVCGDSNNGYGAIYAWGLLGPGQHTMRTYIDNQLVETVTFEVAGLEDAFATDLEATYELDNFPEAGQSTTVRWSEAAQNFIIVGTAP